MDFDATLLARVQFALTIMFHYIFPPLTIGLGAVMVLTEGMFLATGNRQYETMARFWTRIFGVNFAMGVATGIVMEFQFGTNWATYSRFVGDVFGSALAAEGIFAFFLESGFLAVLVFGWDRVKPPVHFFATVMVFLGSMFSAVWIVVANSWQQTPSGYHLVQSPGGVRAEITDFWAMVFNPSSMIRLTHVLIGALILGAFFVMSITAYYVIRGRFVELARKSFGVALVIACIASLAQLIAGHSHAVVVAEYQPAKLAAFEGHFQTGTGGTRLTMMGWPDEKAEELRYAIAIPGMLSFLLYGNTTKPVPGLQEFPRDEWPPVLIPFMSYHVMVGLGTYFIAISLLGAFLYWRNALFNKKWLLWVFVFSVLGPYAANELGWVAAEVGRQPWIVQGMLRTSDAASKAVSASEIALSMVIFGAIYVMLFFVWVYVLNDKIHQGPEEHDRHDIEGMEGVLEAHVGMQDPAGYSLTDAKDDEDEAGGEQK